MSNHQFISYSSVDAKEFAIQLYDALKAGPPSISVWLDERDLKPGQDWDAQIVEAIRVCDGLIFVMTRDSVEDKSVCKLEWARALKYKKPIIPVLLHADAELPFRLGNCQYIDFTGDFDTGLAKLRTHLKWLGSPEGALQAINDRLEDAHRDLRRARDIGQQARIEDEIALLKKELSEKQQIIDDTPKKKVGHETNNGQSDEKMSAQEIAVKQSLESWKYDKYTFAQIKRKFGGFEDDELRKILVGAGAERFKRRKDGPEMWGLTIRNQPRS